MYTIKHIQTGWAVVNTKNGMVQSCWIRRNDARKVANDLAEYEKKKHMIMNSLRGL